MSTRIQSDIGGLEAGPIDRHDHQLSFREKRMDALMQLVRDQRRRMWTVDEIRRATEAVPAHIYENDERPYERLMYGMMSLFIEKGIFTQERIDSRAAEIKARYDHLREHQAERKQQGG